jgi:hypothetical protein
MNSLTHTFYALAVSTLLIFALNACKNGEGSRESCDPLATEGCASGTVCEAVGPGEGLCLEVCDPLAGDPCGEGAVCLKYADGSHACAPTCDPGDSGACGEGWICAPVAGDESVCRPACDLGSAACDDGEVCQPLDDGTAVCTAQCDPLDESGCGEDKACELRTDGLFACYDPVFLRGMVFDSTTQDPIPDAHVIAADKTGASVTDVAITDAGGMYELQVPVERNPDGTLHEGTMTLRVSAADYLPYPHGIRPAIPVDAQQAARQEDLWVLQNPTTDVALIPLPTDMQGQGSISGNILAESGSTKAAGVLVVVEGGTGEAPMGFSDRSGAYTVFNVPAGSLEVHGYKAFLQLDPAPVTLAGGEVKTGVDLVENSKPYGTVTGSVNIVNAPGGSATTVVLVPVSTFNDTFVKGEVPPGLRAPPPPEDPAVTGSYTIEGVPDGAYKVLAAFENDFLVRDPDPGIAGTQVVEIDVPDGASYAIDIATSFKITEALVIISPGATGPELVSGNPTFGWEDDSSEVKYTIVVYNAFGDEVWRDDNLPNVTGSDRVIVDYAGDPLEDGMYYQFRAMSWRSSGPISQTEDLLGVFYTPAAVQ